MKGGLTVGFQNWEGIDRDPLCKYHGIAYIESLSEGNEFAIFAQLGYHVKGSAIRNRNFYNPYSQTYYRPDAKEFLFHNISLTFGGKKKYDFKKNTKAYYMLGIRGDYTIDTNLDEYTKYNELYNSAYFPIDDPSLIQNFNYGVTVGGGLEFAFSELIGGILEFTVSPDFSKQYRQPAIPNVIDPWTGNSRTIPERQIVNTTFEISLGVRLLRKIEYID